MLREERERERERDSQGLAGQPRNSTSAGQQSKRDTHQKLHLEQTEGKRKTGSEARHKQEQDQEGEGTPDEISSSPLNPSFLFPRDHI